MANIYSIIQRPPSALDRMLLTPIRSKFLKHIWRSFPTTQYDDRGMPISVVMNTSKLWTCFLDENNAFMVETDTKEKRMSSLDVLVMNTHVRNILPFRYLGIRCLEWIYSDWMVIYFRTSIRKLVGTQVWRNRYSKFQRQVNTDNRTMLDTTIEHG